MITGTNDQFLVSFSLGVYRLLLAAYPKAFRQEYEADMLQVFRDCCLRDYRQEGSYGVFRLWAVTLLDLITSVIEQHLQKETKLMNKNTLIRLSGWAMILAGIGLFSIFLFFFLDETKPFMHLDKTVYADVTYVYGLIVSPYLLAAGMLGLRARYQQTIGEVANGILLVGVVVGALMVLVGHIGSSSGNGDLWAFIVFGLAFSMLCLTIFGFMALGSKPLPRWNGLPILAGGFVPVLVFLDFVLNITPNYTTWAFALLILQFLALVVLGVILQGDVEQHREAMAAA